MLHVVEGNRRNALEKSLNTDEDPTSKKAMSKAWTADKFEYRPTDKLDPPPVLIMELFAQAAAKRGTDPALVIPTEKSKVVQKEQENITEYNFDFDYVDWRTYYEKTMQVAKALIKLGLEPMDAVAIKGLNSFEWFLGFMGTIAAGGLPVGMYPTDTADAIEYKSKDADVKIVLVGKQNDLEVFATVASKQPSMKHIIAWGETDISNFLNEDKSDFTVSRWEDFLMTSEEPNITFPDRCCCMHKRTPNGEGECHLLTKTELNKVKGKKTKCKNNNMNLKLKHKVDGCDSLAATYLEKQLDSQLRERLNTINPGQAASVVYTSGTTGGAKGVMLSQDSLTWTIENVANQIFLSTDFHKTDRSVSYLPLNHIAGQLMDILGPMYISAKDHNSVVYFPSTCYVKYLCMPAYLQAVEPTIFLGVPEVWDKIKAKLQPSLPKLPSFATKMMSGLVKGKLGLKEMRIALSGAGAIKPDTVAFFHKLKIDILNVYGLSESTGAGTLTTPQTFNMKKTGSIGKVLPGTQIRYVDTEFGTELQLFGRNIMLGYLNKEAKTTAAVDEEGWLATGDIAETDEDGYVWLTGRSKEIMKNHGGEMIAPVLAEQSIEKACEGLVAKVITVGDKEYYLSALVMLPEELDGTEPTGRLIGAAKDAVEGVSTITEAQASTQYTDMLKECFAQYNTDLALNRVARVFRFTILDHAINTEDQDLMTPTQKLKRDGVIHKFSKQYSKCYPCSNIREDSELDCDESNWDGRPKEVLPCEN